MNAKLNRDADNVLLFFVGIDVRTENDFSEWLWKTTGFNCPPANVSCREGEGGNTALVLISRETMVDFLNRALPQGVKAYPAETTKASRANQKAKKWKFGRDRGCTNGSTLQR
jgi:hypothetical protein